MSIINDPRVTGLDNLPGCYRVSTDTGEYDVMPEGYRHGSTDEGDLVTTWPADAGWLVFNSYGVWIGMNHPLVKADEIAAKGRYGTAEQAIAEVLS